MGVMLAGLAAFLGVHLLPTLPGTRETLRARWGEQRYKAVFSFVSLAGLALIAVGYAMADRGGQLFAPSPAAIAAAPFAMAVSFVLVAAANMRGRLRRALRHPMLLGVLIWSVVHLFANGDLRGTVLFGAFFAYAVVDLASAIRRRAVKTFEVVPRHDLIAVAAGVVAALVVMTVHRVLFGVKVVAFGL